ncbi:glyoxalase [Pseudodesulfovibrio sediminis]|uniref:Glyoxalase n=1 Tax=Pseudodesulfovibrio sediminis TaxID=2810563 RepID=A0ABN6EWP2_9BACT|nr:glyoxalase [Pseudodesulfovibrio sediminis]
MELTGKFVWFDLYTTDIVQATRFYDAVFNWSFERTDPESGKVKNILFDHERIGNVIERKDKAKGSQWLSFISVRNTDALFNQALDSGATKLIAPKDMPDRGRVAVVLDPQEALFALVTSPLGDPADVKPTNGYWLGAELWTHDVDAAIQFYATLVGYTAQSLPVHEQVRYTQLLANAIPRCGVVSIPWEDVSPQWVPYVAVLDIQETLARVEAHGGRILIRPQMDIKSGRVAIFKDPTGGILGIQEFQPEEF